MSGKKNQISLREAQQAEVSVWQTKRELKAAASSREQYYLPTGHSSRLLAVKRVEGQQKVGGDYSGPIYVAKPIRLIYQTSDQNRPRLGPTWTRSRENEPATTTTTRANASLANYKNDYANHYIHSGVLPVKYIRNAKHQVEGYPKLERLYRLKEERVRQYATSPMAARIPAEKLVATLNEWVACHIQFDVIMLGALSNNQLLFPLLSQLPLDKLCAKPGFLFIWASTEQISQLSTLLDNNSIWARRFRRAEELIFVPVDKNSPYCGGGREIPEDQIFQDIQWHCWMCITGTVRRSTDSDLIHCNVNTDLSLENDNTGNAAVPSQLYKVAENFSNSTRRLHIIPSPTGLDMPVKLRPGWVIASPDAMIDNFDPRLYRSEIMRVGPKIPADPEVEMLRPKTPPNGLA